MIDDERAAREWVQGQANLYRDFAPGSIGGGYFKAATTILRLLDRPVMPRGSEVPDYVILLMIRAWAERRTGDSVGAMRAAIDDLRAHLTAPPKPQPVTVWAVIQDSRNFAVYATEADAQSAAMKGRVVKLVEADDADR